MILTEGRRLSLTCWPPAVSWQYRYIGAGQSGGVFAN